MKLAVTVCCMVMVLCLLVDDAGCMDGGGVDGEGCRGCAQRNERKVFRDGGFRAGRARRMAHRGP